MSTSVNKFFPSTFAMRFTPHRLTHSIDWHGHLSFAAWLLEIKQPKSIVELGVFRGDSLSTFAQATRELGLSTEILGVDTWAGDETTGRYNEEVYLNLKDYFDVNHPSVRLFRGFFDDALSIVPANSIDILHIDGSHVYEDVKHDYETWLPKMSNQGVILFHDVNVENGKFGTKRFWDEIQHHFPSFKFDHSNGLGVLLCGRNQPEVLLQIADSFTYREMIKAIFELSGAKLFHFAKEKYWRQEAEKHAMTLSYISNNLSQTISQNILAQLSVSLPNTTVSIQKPFFIKRLISKVLAILT